MKRVKYLLSALLLLTGLIIMGELNVLNLSSFMEQYYDADFYIESAGKNVGSDEMKKDFLKASQKNQVDFFIVDSGWESYYQTRMTIIGTDGAIKKLKERGIREGTNKSLFFDEEDVSFISYKDAADISKYNTYYFIGDENDYDRICGFKADLVDKYAGGFPHEVGSERELVIEVLAVWLPIFLVMLMMTAYEIICTKKEYAVRIIIGQNIGKLFVKNVLLDTLSFCVELTAFAFILNGFSNVTFKFKWVAVLFVGFIVINGLINALILKTDYKRELSYGGDGRRLLSVNYALKTVVSVLVMITVSINIATIRQALNLREQQAFFEQHKSAGYCSVTVEADELDDNDLDERCNHLLYEKFQDKAYVYADLTGNFDITYPFVLVNRNSFDELCNINPELNAIRNDVLANKVSILFPEDIEKGSDEYNNALEMNDGGFFKNQEYGEWHTIFYEKNVMAEGIHADGLSSTYIKHMYKNPVIMVDNTEYKTASSGYDDYYSQDILYKITEKELTDFVSSFKSDSIKVSMTDAWKEYEYTWKQQKRQMELAITIMLFIAALECGLVATVIRMEYTINAIEKAVKKVFGYSIKERNERLVSVSVASSIIGIVLSILIKHLAKFDISVLSLAATGLLILFVELLFIVIYALKVEKKSVVNILKGKLL